MYATMTVKFLLCSRESANCCKRMIRLGSFKMVSFQNSSWGIFCSLGGSALGLAPTQKCGVKVMSFICKTAQSTGFCSVPLISGVFSMLTLKEKSCHEVFNGEGEISSQALAKHLKELRNSGPKELDSNNPMKKLVHSQIRLELIVAFACIFNVISQGMMNKQPVLLLGSCIWN